MVTDSGYIYSPLETSNIGAIDWLALVPLFEQSANGCNFGSKAAGSGSVAIKDFVTVPRDAALLRPFSLDRGGRSLCSCVTDSTQLKRKVHDRRAQFAVSGLLALTYESTQKECIRSAAQNGSLAIRTVWLTQSD